MCKKILLSVALALSPVLPAAPQISGEIVDLPGFSFKYSLATHARKSTIWQLWTDVENWDKFDTLLEYSYLENNAPIGEGSIGYLNAEGAPRIRFEISQYNENQSFIISQKLPLYQRIDLQRYFEAGENGTTVFTHEVNFRGTLSALVCMFLCGTFKKETQLVMERLKLLAEDEERQ